MNLFQITANLPGHGEVNLLKSPSVAEAARVLNGLGQRIIIAVIAFENPDDGSAGVFVRIHCRDDWVERQFPWFWRNLRRRCSARR